MTDEFAADGYIPFDADHSGIIVILFHTGERRGGGRQSVV